jgi:hypothetical protein
MRNRLLAVGYRYNYGVAGLEPGPPPIASLGFSELVPDQFQ